MILLKFYKIGRFFHKNLFHVSKSFFQIKKMQKNLQRKNIGMMACQKTNKQKVWWGWHGEF
jgi:hypothetical protein